MQFYLAEPCYKNKGPRELFVTSTMSSQAGGFPKIASKTTFDALAVDSGEESEEETQFLSSTDRFSSRSFVRRTYTNHISNSTSQAETKPSRSAIKRAQKLARTEKRQQQKALAKAQRGNSPTESSAAPSEEPSSVTVHEATVHDPPTESRDNVPLDAGHVSSRAVTDAPVESPIKSGMESSKSSPLPRPIPVTNLAPLASCTPPPPVLPFDEEHTLAPVEPTHKQRPLKESPVNDAEKLKKRQSFITRTLWTFIMIGGFLGMVSSSTLTSQLNEFYQVYWCLGTVTWSFWSCFARHSFTGK